MSTEDFDKLVECFKRSCPYRDCYSKTCYENLDTKKCSDKCEWIILFKTYIHKDFDIKNSVSNSDKD
jgi:hypothetical protein